MNRTIRSVDREAIGEGTSLFRHELDAIQAIRSQLESECLGKLVPNVNLYDSANGTYHECDIIIAAPSGLYVVELKHWSGSIEVRGYDWIRNHTNYERSPHRSNQFKCKVLKSMYQQWFVTYPDLWVESIVVLTHPDCIVQGASSPNVALEIGKHNHTFGSVSDFLLYMRKMEHRAGGSILDRNQIDAIQDYLLRLERAKRGHKHTIPGYDTVEYLRQTPELIELLARPIRGRHRGLERFRVFRPPVDVTPDARDSFEKKAGNALDAIVQIGDHPNIHRVRPVPNDYDYIMEVSDWSEAGTLRDFLQRQDDGLDTRTSLAICLGIARALRAAHGADVVHRAVKPENVLMMNGIPKLMNFDLSYQIEDDRLTVMPDVTEIKDDGYVAPEILSGEDFDEGTDFFGLGVIAYEMLAGAKPFATIRQFNAEGGALTGRAIERLTATGAPYKVVDAIVGMVVADRRTRLKDPTVILEAFAEDSPETAAEVAESSHNAILQPGDTHDVFTILEFIGEGAASQVYKAATLRGRVVALKVFNREVPVERITREWAVMHAINSSYVVKCDRVGHWLKDRYFIPLDYVDGQSMGSMIDRGEVPDSDTFRTVALCLMEAVKAFHQSRDEEGNDRPFLHSDIKPDNVLITEDKKAVLIDCGIAGEPRVDVFAGTPGYVPPDSICGTDMQFSESGDLFALGVTLWEWLFGRKPYESPAIGELPDAPDNLSGNVQEYLAWLKKAVATETHERFTSIQDMHDAFLTCSRASSRKLSEDEFEREKALEQLDMTMLPQPSGTAKPEDQPVTPRLSAVHNPFVGYLNSLSNASAANENSTAESQIGNEFFARVHVRNPIAEHVCEMLFERKVNVILTGNAGDGKTTIAADIVRKVKGEMPRSLQPREDIAEAGLVVIKDLSELNETARIQVLHEAMVGTANRYLIVSNTGKLLGSFRQLRQSGFDVDDSELLGALESSSPQSIADGKFLLLNIGRIDSIDTACKIFKRMLDESNWNRCHACERTDECPISQNAKLIQSDLDLVCRRVELTYRRLYEYDARLTLRQMTGHLAYAVTAGLDCTDIAEMSHVRLQADRLRTMFFNRFFGDDGKDIVPEAMQLIPVRRIAESEFGTFLDSAFERNAWTNREFLRSMSEAARNVHGWIQETSSTDPHSARSQVRRLVYFCSVREGKAGERYICNFLRSPTLLDFLKHSRGTEVIGGPLEVRYRSRVLRVLQEHFLGVRLPGANWLMNDLYITLAHREGGAGTQIVLAALRQDDFYVALEPTYVLGDQTRNVFCLRYVPEDISMPLDLPFLDYVTRVHEGEIAEELSPYYSNRLDKFRTELLRASRNRRSPVPSLDDRLTLLRLGDDYDFETIRVQPTGTSLEVS